MLPEPDNDTGEWGDSWVLTQHTGRPTVRQSRRTLRELMQKARHDAQLKQDIARTVRKWAADKLNVRRRQLAARTAGRRNGKDAARCGMFNRWKLATNSSKYERIAANSSI